ncbi:hypothetical protein GHT09_006705 [Marmota monax]|uniref:G-protein coupled receptors family 3 profile domain-containing protein n=1 Tax=Marmota monax TaxID=9995 RepID=A0A834V523_MARMO|nr:hypothetical protein GHT09_006705 [Marmota monax]
MPLPLRWFWKNYQYVLAFYFAIEEINRDLHLLPNLTLGFHVFNAFHSDHRTLETALLWLSGDTEFLPNYKCQTQSKAIGTLLELYKMPQVHPFLKNVRFTNSAGDHISLGEKSSQMAQYDIHNAVNFPAGLGLLVKVGEFVPRSPLGQGLVISEEMIEWPIGFTETPRSVCRQSCPPGFRKIPQEGRPVCCFACVFCPEGHISNQTAAVLGVFVKHRDTPIVKANNRALSYILLISLTFCFLCSLLFIGRPGTATCILQEATFGLVFTVAVSTVLAKTVTVILAFKVTAPGRRMRRWLVSGAPNFIIPSCSLIQLTLCGVWLGNSPPFVDTDTHSDHGHIIITCNKGSVTAFYCAL